MNQSDFIESLKEIDWLSEARHISSVIEADYAWEWLPTSRDQEDPYQVIGEERDLASVNELALDAYKATLASLRGLDSKRGLLKDGVNDYWEAFRGAALFCARCAAKEVATGNLGRWCQLLNVYKQGRWPCGVASDGSLVIM